MRSDNVGPPYLTADIPGIGGVIKESADDFMVTEIPQYLPCGEGEHLYVEMEKRGMTTLEAIRRLARALDIQERDIGYAGLKDARGVTRQTVSLPRVKPDLVLSLSISGIRILSAVRHRNKLKLGHLAGNRFSLVVRTVRDDAADRVMEMFAILSVKGVANFFGPQRYGIQGNSHLIGRALLTGSHKAAVDAIMGDPAAVTDERWKAAIVAYRAGNIGEALALLPPTCRNEREILQRLVSRPDAYDKALHALNPRLKSLFLSAWQSALFDLILAERLPLIDRVEQGDLAWKHANGACFLVEDLDEAAPRAARFEISPSGPLFGASMTWPTGEPGRREVMALTSEGLSPAGPAGGWPNRLEGARRPLRVPLDEPAVRQDGDALLLDFSLPKGSYATAVLREVMKDW